MSKKPLKTPKGSQGAQFTPVNTPNRGSASGSTGRVTRRASAADLAASSASEATTSRNTPGGSMIPKEWSDAELVRIGLPPKDSLLSDEDIYHIIESELSANDRQHTYRKDFIQKGFVRKGRPHIDPPALIDLEGPNRVSYYAVVCGTYQLHGEEGERKGLSEDVGAGVRRSLRIPTRTGDYRVAISDPRVTGPNTARTMKEKGMAPPAPVDESDLSETSASDGGSKAAYGEEMLRYAVQMDALLNLSLRLNRELLETRPKGQAGGPTGLTKRFNEIKRGWAELKGSLTPELGKKVRDGIEDPGT